MSTFVDRMKAICGWAAQCLGKRRRRLQFATNEEEVLHGIHVVTASGEEMHFLVSRRSEAENEQA